MYIYNGFFFHVLGFPLIVFGRWEVLTQRNIKIMAKIKAKFECTLIVENEEKTQKTVTLIPVNDGTVNNESFSKFVPSGSTTVVINSDTEADTFFTEGDFYFLEFYLIVAE